MRTLIVISCCMSLAGCVAKFNQCAPGTGPAPAVGGTTTLQYVPEYRDPAGPLPGVIGPLDLGSPYERRPPPMGGPYLSLPPAVGDGMTTTPMIGPDGVVLCNEGPGGVTVCQ